MQPVRRLLSFGHRNPHFWSARRDLSRLGPSPLRRTLTSTFGSFPIKSGAEDNRVIRPIKMQRWFPSALHVSALTGHGLSNVCIKHLNLIVQSHASKWLAKLIMHREWMHNLCPSGRNLCVGSFLGISAVTGVMNLSPKVAYAMNGYVEGHLSDSGDPSDFLKQDLDTVWELTKRFQLPAVLFLTVLFGWRHPIILAVNVFLLLFCTRPNPLSVYIFIEQLRRRAMRQNPGLYKTKLFYAKRVEVQDYKLLCFAKVELRDVKLSLIGVLGNWWILHSSPK